MIISSLIAVFVNYFLLRKSLLQLQKLALIVQDVTVIKTIGNKLIQEQFDSTNLVPGDLFYIEENVKLPCDCLVVSGDVMVNEATLTGESIPVPKQQIRISDASFNIEKFSQNCLFEGTKTVKIKQTEERRVTGMVLRTGFGSLRGQYFRNVLFPDPLPQSFYVQACKFLAGLAVWIIITYFCFLPYLIDIGYADYLIATRFLLQSDFIILYRFFDAITWIIPPALPIFFQISKTVSLIRLNFNGILGSNPEKIQSAGIIDTICFDKTGTLTNLGLKVFGHWINGQNEAYIWQIMASCHHLTLIDGEMMGDPLEIEMVKYSRWNVNFVDEIGVSFNVTDGNTKLDIVKIFEFSSQMQMMSVICHNKQTNKYFLFAKGAPEKICSLSLEGDLKEINEQVKQYSVKGLRVIGLGMRELTQQESGYERLELEQQLEFSGLFILENQLKDDTAKVIGQLNEANLMMKVISGDNALTTINCAKEAGLVEQQCSIILLDFDQEQVDIISIPFKYLKNLNNIFNSQRKKYLLFQQDIVVQTIQNDQIVDQSSSSPQVLEDGSLIGFSTSNRNCKKIELCLTQQSEIAVTGKLLQYLSACQLNSQANIQDLVIHNNNKRKIYQNTPHLSQNQIAQQTEFQDKKLAELLIQIIYRAKIFARSKPEQKKQVVAELQKQGRKVTMVGDGANDCVIYFNYKQLFSQLYLRRRLEYRSPNQMLHTQRHSHQNLYRQLAFSRC